MNIVKKINSRHFCACVCNEQQVLVGDANDNSPQFDSSSYEAEVPESSPVGTTILRLHADDPDHGPNGVVVYSLSHRPGLLT